MQPAGGFGSGPSIFLFARAKFRMKERANACACASSACVCTYVFGVEFLLSELRLQVIHVLGNEAQQFLHGLEPLQRTVHANAPENERKRNK